MKHILFVEDETGVARFVKKGLTAAGYTVALAASGTEGLRQLRESLPDLLIVDIMLPGMNGLELMKAARTLDEHMPILVLSAHDDLEDKLAGFEHGADDYLPKPFEFAELLARISALARRSRKPLEIPVLTYHEITMNLLAHSVSVAGKSIDLSKREFDLLEFFLRHREKVISRTTISEEVWHEDFDRETNLVEVYIMYLRKKLEYKSERWIQTVRGAGYRLLKTRHT